uniref:SGNH_hydro domain-containing protein n=1 Tax=Strongyloides venezuelensis TaxID=75913 RepID=A0A0K0FIF0_STRVS
MLVFLGDSSSNFGSNNVDDIGRKELLNKFFNRFQQSYKNMFLQPPSYLRKRGYHNIETRSVNEFNNCYFSPIQCVMDKRKK